MSVDEATGAAPVRGATPSNATPEVRKGRVVEHLEENRAPSPVAEDDVLLQRAEVSRQRSMDRLRGRVTLGLLASCLVLTTTVEILAITSTVEAWKRVESVIPIVVSPFYTLLAIAAGYYFAHQKEH
jgi:hypothetical protein